MGTACKAPIDWKLLYEAKAFYEALGFEYVEVPWIVHQSVTNATFDGMPHRTQHGDLVGSAEQSFIQMILLGELLPGKYQAITPCFRSDVLDETHESHFMKLELIDMVRPNNWRTMACLVEGFMQSHIPTRVVDIDESQCDIETPDGIELGSYGRRDVGSVSFAYGTGLAEPRFSTAVRKFYAQDG